MDEIKRGRPSNRVVLAILIVGMLLGLAIFQVGLTLTTPMKRQLSLEETFYDAINRTMSRDQGSVNDLTPIVFSNPDLIKQGTADNWTVLVVTWTKYSSSYPVGSNVTTWWGETWVTVAPEITGFFKDHVDRGTNLTLRAAQLLGLPPSTTNQYFVEMWVHPSDLFRPSADNEINDTSASLAIPQNINATYKQWFDGNTIYSYYPKHFPWTRLGHTYDWGSSTGNEGLSEFVLKKNSNVLVSSVTTNAEYLNVLGSAS